MTENSYVKSSVVIPPSTPMSITSSNFYIVDRDIEVEWGVSLSNTYPILGYLLERKIADEDWLEVSRGAHHTFIEPALSEWSSVSYRVSAYDSQGNLSNPITTPVKALIITSPPMISGEDSDLGVKTVEFNTPYTVSCEDTYATLQVTEELDGVIIRSFSLTGSGDYSLDIQMFQFLALVNGQHEITITVVSDFNLKTVRTYTFSKDTSELAFGLHPPLQADDMATKGVVNIVRKIPEGATFKVEMCNNAFDFAPTWEDITQYVISRTKFNFANTTKTASNWGINIRVSINRLDTTGECYVASVSGNFE